MWSKEEVLKKQNPHHVLYTRKPWMLQKPTRMLRENHWLRVPMDREVHDALHREIASVPLPDHFMAGRVLETFEPVEGDYIKTLDMLRFAFNTAVKHPHVNYVERRLGGLIVESLGLQRAYIDEGLYRGDFTSA